MQGMDVHQMQQTHQQHQQQEHQYYVPQNQQQQQPQPQSPQQQPQYPQQPLREDGTFGPEVIAVIDTWGSPLDDFDGGDFMSMEPPVEQATGGSGALGDFSMFGGLPTPQFSGMQFQGCISRDPMQGQSQPEPQPAQGAEQPGGAGSSFMSNIFDMSPPLAMGNAQ